MKAYILNEDNPEPHQIGDGSTTRIDRLLGMFLRAHQLNPGWRHKHILLTLDEHEEEALMATEVCRGDAEFQAAFKLRVLSTIAQNANEVRNLVGGFCATYTSETIGGRLIGKQRMGFTFTQFPQYTCSINTMGNPTKGSYISISGRIVPPEA